MTCPSNFLSTLNISLSRFPLFFFTFSCLCRVFPTLVVDFFYYGTSGMELFTICMLIFQIIHDSWKRFQAPVLLFHLEFYLLFSRISHVFTKKMLEIFFKKRLQVYMDVQLHEKYVNQVEQQLINKFNPSYYVV